ncbi:MAG: DUF58 domain-containing protein [Planctomycetota bacterium]|nr:DUF58 domain-containing protein [Planctomycetota bacterium]
MVRRILSGPLRLIRQAPHSTYAGGIALTFFVLAFWFAIFLKHNGVIFVVCGIVSTALLSAVVTALSVGRLEAHRALPKRVFAGSPFTVRLKVTNVSRFRPAFGLTFRDALQKRSPGQATCGPVVPLLPPGASASLIYESRIHRRGVYPIDYALAATRYPFGLFEAQRLVRSPGRIIVLPQLGKLQRRARRELAHRAAQPRVRRMTQLHKEEFHSIREYRPGDNPRHIHWRTSAHVMKLMRRELQGEASAHLTVLLDTFVGGGHAEIRRRHFERAVSCAATLLVDAARRGRPATLIQVGGKVGHSGDPSGAMRTLDVLASIGAGTVRPADVVKRLAPAASSLVLCLSLHGSGSRLRRAARRVGMDVLVWDVSAPGFERYFHKR